MMENDAKAERCIVAVHAHPDDESTKGAATIASYAARGVKYVLVCCTDGAAGKAGGNESVKERRSRELDAAAQILGFDRVYQLGYPDSDMDGTVEDGFATLRLETIADQLATIFDAERANVIITYDPVYAAGHPDHKRAHDASVAAFNHPMNIGARRPAKLYGTRTHSPRKLDAMHRWLLSNHRPSPYTDALGGTDPTTTSIDVADFINHSFRALQAHTSQVAEDDPWFYSVPADALRAIYPYEDLTLLATRVPIKRNPAGVETDLLSGLS